MTNREILNRLALIAEALNITSAETQMLLAFNTDGVRVVITSDGTGRRLYRYRVFYDDGLQVETPNGERYATDLQSLARTFGAQFVSVG
jgi:hypothetical protein